MPSIQLEGMSLSLVTLSSCTEQSLFTRRLTYESQHILHQFSQIDLNLMVLGLIYGCPKFVQDHKIQIS